MAENDRQHWEERYRTGDFGFREPDRFFIEAHENYLTPLLSSGSAGLDLAGGAGHHALWLANQGWRMTLVDWSATALDIARKRASDLSAGEQIEIVHDTAFNAVTEFYDHGRRFSFVLVSFFLDRAVLSLLPRVLLPGGLLLYRTYTVENARLGNPRGPRNPEFLLRSQELLEVYRGMKILHYNETVAAKGVAELIVQHSGTYKGRA